TGQRQVEPEVPLSCTHLPASSRFFAISTYSWFSSIPTQSRPCFSATRPVVPLPKNGSRTMPRPLPSLPSHWQVGFHPAVILSTIYPVLNTLVFPCRPCALCILLLWAIFIGSPRSVILTHGAPQCGHAFSGEPARIHGSIRSGGNTAKCAPLKGFVGMDQTVRLLRPLGCLPHEALSNEPPITPAFMPLSER